MDREMNLVLWEYLEEVDKKILTYFIRICHLFVNRILETKSLDEIHKKIVDIVTLIEKKYGRNQIEPELMRRLINDNRINEMIYTENNSKESTISEKEPFPGEILKLFSDGILDLMVAYYNNTYENLKFWKPFETDSLNSIKNKQIFSYILAKFASEDDSIDIYPDQIQFFFVYEISTNRINIENHYLAYVRLNAPSHNGRTGKKKENWDTKSQMSIASAHIKRLLPYRSCKVYPKAWSEMTRSSARIPNLLPYHSYRVAMMDA
ncbi:hypothetical protein Glove_519g103 [Diversispora epigaea]|uniref:Uncharacterized protein n=1 Tax=Diversispora epigaea TaxID=1348612 RepID=A0A397GGJ9_9GLOM|nr:hypothetical protein Glove_519g103 [Diversispora epigaea]